MKILPIAISLLCLFRDTNDYIYIFYIIGAENKMDSGKNSREHRAIQGKFDVIVEHLAANTDPAQFAQKLYQVEMVSQHVVEGARVVVFTPSQRIQPVMVAVQSCIELQPSKYADFIQVVRDVYPALADVLNEYYSK